VVYAIEIAKAFYPYFIWENFGTGITHRIGLNQKSKKILLKKGLMRS